MLYEPGGIMQHARRLVTEYAAVRQKLEEVMTQGRMQGVALLIMRLQTETDRPIIWICHDLGGTIVKEVGTPLPLFLPFANANRLCAWRCTTRRHMGRSLS